MGGLLSRVGTTPSQSQPCASMIKRKKPKKFSYNEVKIMKQYLPTFVFMEKSTEEQRHIAAIHWDKVFKDTAGAKNKRQSSTMTIDPKNKEAKPIGQQQNSKITELYDIFYAELEQYGPELKNVFRSSMHVRGRVLVHISTGMRTLIIGENFMEKVVALTKTHRRFGVKLEYYDYVGQALLFAMEKTSGPHWSAEINDAWRRLYSHTSVILIKSQLKDEKQAEKAATKAVKQMACTSSQIKVTKEKDISRSVTMLSAGPTTNLFASSTVKKSRTFYELFPSIRNKNSVRDISLPRP